MSQSTAKKSAFSPRIIPNLQFWDEKKSEYKARFSKAYTPAGHDFTKSFDVLREAYFFNYQLLTLDDIGLYEHLHFLAKKDYAFTLEQLAVQFKISKTTLRERLDALENCELIETVKVCVAKGGDQNLYLIRTPYFEKESLIGTESHQSKRRKRLLDAGEPLPQVYLETEVERLRRAIKNNHARQKRELMTAEERRAQKRNWAVLFHEIGTDLAVKFDNLVVRVMNHLKDKKDAFETWEIFDNLFKSQALKLGIEVSSYLLKKAREICVFYQQWNDFETNRAAAASLPPAAPSAPARTAETGDASDGDDNAGHTAPQIVAAPQSEIAEAREMDVKMIQDAVSTDFGRTAFKLRTIADFVRFFREFLEREFLPFTFAELEPVAAPLFDSSTWQEIRRELIE